MALSKTQTLTVLGRRNKQQILKDFIRPVPSNVVSSPVVGGGGFIGGGADCSPDSSQPSTGTAGAIATEDEVECDYLWSVSGMMTDPDGNTILSSNANWFIDESGLVDGQLSGTPIIMPAMDAVGGMDSVLFGASYDNSASRTATLQSNCTFLAEDESAIYGTFTINGDYFSDPYLDYPVFGISESDGYQTTILLNALGGGNIRRLKYFASGRHTYGSLATERFGDPITPGWIFDEWVIEDLTEDGVWRFIPTGIVGNVIPYTNIVRTNPVTGIRERTYRIGNWSETTTASGTNNNVDVSISYERLIEWNVGVGASEHPQHFAAAYKGRYSAITVDWVGIHQFFIDADDYDPLPSNSRKALPMERTSTYAWEYPYQTIATVYNVWVEGLLIPSDSWTWNPDTLVLTLETDYPPDTSVLADAMVQ